LNTAPYGDGCVYGAAPTAIDAHDDEQREVGPGAPPDDRGAEEREGGHEERGEDEREALGER